MTYLRKILNLPYLFSKKYCIQSGILDNRTCWFLSRLPLEEENQPMYWPKNKIDRGKKKKKKITCTDEKYQSQEPLL